MDEQWRCQWMSRDANEQGSPVITATYKLTLHAVSGDFGFVVG